MVRVRACKCVVGICVCVCARACVRAREHTGVMVWECGISDVPTSLREKSNVSCG